MCTRTRLWVDWSLLCRSETTQQLHVRPASKRAGFCCAGVKQHSCDMYQDSLQMICTLHKGWEEREDKVEPHRGRWSASSERRPDVPLLATSHYGWTKEWVHQHHVCMTVVQGMQSARCAPTRTPSMLTSSAHSYDWVLTRKVTKYCLLAVLRRVHCRNPHSFVNINKCWRRWK